jgi:exocyst complex component 7
LDAYGSARRQVAYNSMDSYYRRLKQDRKKRLEKNRENMDEADAAARDAVRCLEHAMVVIAGEKNVYRTIVHPSMAKTDDDDDMMHESEESTSPFYKKACVGAYSYVAGAVVDRALDIIETVFLKEGGIGQMSGAAKDGSSSSILTVQQAASAAAAGLRMLDGVRMLGPSLAKLCEMPVGDNKTESSTSIASVLCIAIHRTTVKNTARTLENLAKAIQEDPMKGPLHRPKDASISSVSRDAVHAIRRVSPFMSAYKSVSKRRALPWDPNMGDDAGDLDAFVRFLVMRLLNSLKGKALDYTREARDDSQAKSNLFMLNNAFFLLEELGPNSFLPGDKLDADTYRITGSWFVDKINKMSKLSLGLHCCALLLTATELCLL